MLLELLLQLNLGDDTSVLDRGLAGALASGTLSRDRRLGQAGHAQAE